MCSQCNWLWNWNRIQRFNLSHLCLLAVNLVSRLESETERQEKEQTNAAAWLKKAVAGEDQGRRDLRAVLQGSWRSRERLFPSLWHGSLFPLVRRWRLQSSHPSEASWMAVIPDIPGQLPLRVPRRSDGVRRYVPSQASNSANLPFSNVSHDHALTRALSHPDRSMYVILVAAAAECARRRSYGGSWTASRCSPTRRVRIWLSNP